MVTVAQLLDAAEATACAPPLNARTLVMHILAGRPELQLWYEKRGYTIADGVPPGTIVRC